ncbi:DASS family sodium-coupled anion symporter [Methanorbis furvi]|uniref:Sodium-dependent dicarboxylate transporter SdcS n=1 Tax=Methanorbis furvi TaxID=3028299 RepID=A0AAE4MCS0_9EURY|nr:Sodium-dependent dicarboxylate transporter SdcS [Methanocorpusculaceae archaeon Ag1]
MDKRIGLILGIATFIAILLIPIDPTILPVSARYAAAVTVLMAIFWITQPIPIEATALIPIVAFPLLGILSPAEACAPYADKIIFLFLGGFIIAMSMQRWGLHKRIALKIIGFTGTSPRRLVLGFMIATAFLSMWMSNTATAMMMIPIAIAIIATVLPTKVYKDMTTEQKAFAGCLVLAVAYAASIGGIATLIGTPANGILVAQMQILFPEAPTIDFFTWLKFGIPLLLIFIPIAWLWLTRVAYRKMPKTLDHAKDVLTQEITALGPMSRGEKNTLAVFILTAFLWIFEKNKDLGPITIPGLEMIFPGIDDCTVAIFGALLLFLIPVNWKKQEFTMNWEWAVRIPWGILLLFGGGMCLSAAFIKSGLAQAIVGYFSVLNGVPIVLLVIIIAVVVMLLTEVTSNTAIASVMMPILAVTALSLQVNPWILMMTAAVCSSFAFMLPVATPPNAIAYSTEYVEMKDMINAGWAMNLLGVAIFTILLFTLVLWAFGLTPGLPDWALVTTIE